MRSVRTSLTCVAVAGFLAFSAPSCSHWPAAKTAESASPCGSCDSCASQACKEKKPKEDHPCCMMSGDVKIDPVCAEGMKEKGIQMGVVMGFKIRTSGVIAREEPLAILALKSDLELSDEQVRKLRALQQDTQQKALVILTAEQKKSLAQVPDAATMSELCEDMRREMVDRLEQGKVPALKQAR